jgi:hypothetical protein
MTYWHKTWWDKILDADRERKGLRRLSWAWSNHESADIGLRANALHVLCDFYNYGWNVAENENIAFDHLEQSAKLGHAKSCYDMARRALDKECDIEKAREFIRMGLACIDDTSFDCKQENYVQAEHKIKLEELMVVCKFREENPYIYSKSG